MTRAGGYRLRVEPDAFDLERFESLLERGRELLAEAAALEAPEALREALGFGEGRRLRGSSSKHGQRNEIGRLEELRLVALELRLEADLALGRHAEAVTELEASSATIPFARTSRGLLMLAPVPLGPTGRRARRLSASTRSARRRTRHLTRATALQELETHILSQDANARSAPTLENAASRRTCPFSRRR